MVHAKKASRGLFFMMKMKDYIKQQLINYASENIDSKYIRYLNKYITLINSLLINQQIDEIITEAHHIVPRSWNPDLIYDENNIICVSVKAHLILHHMLALTRDTRMCRAFYSMINMKPKDVFNYAVHVNLAAQAKQMWYDISVRPVVNLNTGEVFGSATAAAAYVGVKSISDPINNHYRGGPYYWQYKDIVDATSLEHQLQICLDKQEANKQRLVGLRKPLVNLNTGEVVPSIASLAKTCNVTTGTITDHINKRTKIAGNFYQFKHVVDQTNIDCELQKCLDSQRDRGDWCKRAVVNLNTGEVFESIKDAQLSLQRNLNIAGAISKRCRCGGYHGQYKDVVEQTSIEEQLNQYELHKITAKENRKRIKSQIGCKVKCVETGEIFATMTQAAKHFNTTCNCISRHTNRGTCTQAGYHFVLYEDKHS